ncbi:hypothetical protein GDO81_024605 [Engystomops pustulosus]|uniref:Uncharacterized protein n=1 Tax=Engystomops pustulosus TaxID=76066 RepID=A0AAV6ZN01_ENGPU|nr:hypothetical protein GDO81_024605 [Engystomops pustulosus]
MYAFPPVPVIPKVVKKIQKERGKVILVVPFWPKKVWFPSLRRLALEEPVHLPPRTDLLFQGPVLHPNPQALQLSAWILKGNY